jgi:protein-L-isoaspartate(D-aspartate) O-methyltransferase
VTTLSDTPAPTADLRNRLTDQLVADGIIRTPAVEAAFRTVPRHLCLPGVPFQEAYADAPVYIKQQGPVAVSAASQPTIVAMMLEQLHVQPGDNILEIGAGTGYNAALLATLTGPSGHVTTIDVDDDLVAGARQHLTAAGITNADAVLGDGALGYPLAAPFDKIIATVGAAEVPAAWLDQTAPGGRLVIPLRLRGAASRSIEFERGPAGWVSTGSRLAVFMPLRGGIRDDPRRIVPLTARQDVTLQVHQDQHADLELLTGVLDGPRHEEWTSVLFPPDVPYEWMDLWLCLTLPNALMRMNAQPDTVTRGQVSPMFGWGSMATTDGASLAYLTTRPAPPAADDDGKRYEVGIIAHGPDGPRLAAQVGTQIQAWDNHFRDRHVQFSLPADPGTSDPANGRFVLDRPARPITVTWH